MNKHVLAVVVAALAGFAAPALAQDKLVELKMSHWVPPAHAMHKTAQSWIESIDKASKGTIKIALYPAQQLGKAPDHYDMALKGIADISYINVGYQAGRMLIANAGQLPFLMSTAEGGSRAYDEWYRPYAAKDMPGVKMCLMFIHDPGALHSKIRISHPDQIKGMKIRPAQVVISDWMKQLGATTVNVSAPESREALERGVADAITFPWMSIYLFGIDKVTKYHMDAALYTTGFSWIINLDRYNAMSTAQKKVIDDHCNGEWAQRYGKEWGDYEFAGRAKSREDKGHTVVPLTTAELAAWKKSAEPVVKAWADEARKAGYDPDKVLGELNQTLVKYKAKAQ